MVWQDEERKLSRPLTDGNGLCLFVPTVDLICDDEFDDARDYDNLHRN